MATFSWFNVMIPQQSPRTIEYVISNGYERATIGEVDVWSGRIKAKHETPWHLANEYNEDGMAELAMVYAMALLAMTNCSMNHIAQAKERSND